MTVRLTREEARPFEDWLSTVRTEDRVEHGLPMWSLHGAGSDDGATERTLRPATSNREHDALS